MRRVWAFALSGATGFNKLGISYIAAARVDHVTARKLRYSVAGSFREGWERTGQCLTSLAPHKRADTERRTGFRAPLSLKIFIRERGRSQRP